MSKKNPKKGGSATPWLHLTAEEMLSVVCHLFIRGLTTKEIERHMIDVYGETNFNRQHPYSFVRQAAQKGMLSFQFRPDQRSGAVAHLRRKCPGLKTIDVVPTVLMEDVAERAAAHLVDFMRTRPGGEQGDLRIGLMGGGTVLEICRALARMLSDLDEASKTKLPSLTFQALVVGDNVREPLEDPAAFFTYFADPALNPIRRAYVSLHAPVFMDKKVEPHYIDHEFETLRGEALQCDVVLISAGCIGDPHSFLGSLQASARETWSELLSAGCVGDLGRLPVGADGPLALSHFARPPCTLLTLEELSNIVAKGRRVMLVAGPCGECKEPKPAVIETLLRLWNHGHTLFSDLVIDNRTARGIAYN